MSAKQKNPPVGSRIPGGRHYLLILIDTACFFLAYLVNAILSAFSKPMPYISSQSR